MDGKESGVDSKLRRSVNIVGLPMSTVYGSAIGFGRIAKIPTRSY